MRGGHDKRKLAEGSSAAGAEASGHGAAAPAAVPEGARAATGAAGSAAAEAAGGKAGDASAGAAVAEAAAEGGKAGRRSWLTTILAVLLFLAGAALLLYPTVSNLIAEHQQLDAIGEYQGDVVELTDEEMEAEWAAAREYNENLAGDPVHDPFVMGSGYALPENYEEVLNVNDDGIMGYLEIPKIDLMLPIYHGTSEEVLEKGVGHIDYTSLPIGGESTHSVLSAHRGLPSAELFTRLDEMEIGDVFYVTVLDETHAYEVDQIQVVEPEDLSKIQIEPGEDYVTLLTCTPYGVNTQRLLVRGTRVPYDGGDGGIDSAWGNFNLKLAILLLIVALVVIAVIVMIARRYRKRRALEAAAGAGAEAAAEAAGAPEARSPPEA